jgi:hypothetical protein
LAVLAGSVASLVGLAHSPALAEPSRGGPTREAIEAACLDEFAEPDGLGKLGELAKVDELDRLGELDEVVELDKPGELGEADELDEVLGEASELDELGRPDELAASRLGAANVGRAVLAGVAGRLATTAVVAADVRVGEVAASWVAVGNEAATGIRVK